MIFHGHRNRQIPRILDLGRSLFHSRRKGCAQLEQSGLVTVSRVGTQKHYQANPKSPIFAELCAISQKTVGLAEPLREALAPLAARMQGTRCIRGESDGTTQAVPHRLGGGPWVNSNA